MSEILNVATETIGADKPFSGRGKPLQRIASRLRFVACVQVFDYLIFCLIGLVWFRTLSPHTLGQWWLLHLVVSALVAAMIHCVFQCFRLYDFRVLTRGREAAARAFTVGLISFVPFLGQVLIQPGVTDETTMTACGLVAAGVSGIALWRMVLARLAVTLRQSGVVGRRIYVIADSTAAAASLRATLEQLPDNRVVGTWTLSGSMGPMEEALEGTLDFLRDNPIDVVILKMPLSQPDRLVEAAHVLRSLPHTVLLTPSFDSGDDIVLPPQVSRADEWGNIVLVKLSDRPLSGWRWVIKDIQDRALALLLLAIVSPAMLTIAIAIKLADPGPVFFRQKRFCYAGNTFDIIKFRTMRVARNPQEPRSLNLTIRDDPRVFSLGRILRKTSLDELPQLLNVLRGDMWIVGPRPHSPYAQAGGQVYRKAVRGYAARYRIKPGITGWAQVCGWRGPTDTLEQLNKRVEHDLYYIENWSASFDIYILFKTLFCVLGHANAY